MSLSCSLLEKARSAEAAGLSGDAFRLGFHLMPPAGWLNDPNGLCQFGDDIHIFFQYNPLDIAPGSTNYWGHYTTRDYVHYDYHLPALCGDSPRDENGVYSGSALADESGITLFYTGNVKHPGDYDYTLAGREHNTMTARSTDGIHFDHKQVLLTNEDYPEDLTLHVRDPKVFVRDGSTWMVLGARSKADVGEALLYREDPSGHWALANRLTTPGPLGYMWECPDLFTLGDATYLAISPQGVEARGERFNNVYQSGVLRLTGDPAGDAALTDFTEYDAGFDFYAPQTFADARGRRILIAWMGLPDIPYTNPTADEGWMHALTLPRELTVEDGRLCQHPLAELTALRGAKRAVPLEGAPVETPQDERFEAILTNSDPQASFEATLRGGCRLTYDGQVLRLSFDACGCGRDQRQRTIPGVHRLHIFCDTSSVEIFVNDGSTVFTSRFYPEKPAPGITLSGMSGQLDYWPLSSFSIRDLSAKEYENV